MKLSLPEGQKAPEWVQDLLDSGYLTEVRTCLVMADLQRAWSTGTIWNSCLRCAVVVLLCGLFVNQGALLA